MIKIEITKREASRLINYIENAIQSGRFGGGEISTPEEILLINKIKNCNGVLEISFTKFMILCEFIYDAIGSGIAIHIEDGYVIRKLLFGLETYYKDVRQKSNIDEIEKAIESVKRGLLFQEDIVKKNDEGYRDKSLVEIAVEKELKREAVEEKLRRLDKLTKGLT